MASSVHRWTSSVESVMDRKDLCELNQVAVRHQSHTMTSLVPRKTSHVVSLMKRKCRTTVLIAAVLLGLLRATQAFVVPKHKLVIRNANPPTQKQTFRIVDTREHTQLFLSPDMMPTESVSLLLSDLSLNIDSDTAEAIAGPFFAASLFPYLAFLYFLNVEENMCPKGVVVGFATCLLFVFLTIPAAIAAKTLYGVSLADSDWLHGSAESLLTVTNLVTVVAFRQALEAKEKDMTPPKTATSYAPMTWLVVGLTALAGATALVPALANPQVHTPYLGAFMDLPFSLEFMGGRPEPENALTVACWIIHTSSLVEFLVAMGFCWRWADVSGNPRWKGLTWGLLPLHSSGITACTYHLFYNQIPIMVPFQALLTCVGNTTAAYAALRIALSNGWMPPFQHLADMTSITTITETTEVQKKESDSLVGFEDLGDALANDNDYSFLIKLFFGCAIGSYAVKYGATFFSFPYDANEYLALAFVGVPSGLNAYKWYKRSQDPSFEGWF